MTIKHASTAGLLLASVVALAASPTAGQANQISSCAAIVEDAARLHCYDRLAGRTQSEQDLQQKEPVPIEAALPLDQENASVQSVADTRQKTATDKRWLGIRSYKRNYILPVSYNDRVNLNAFNDSSTNFNLDDIEVKFQLSAELPLWENILEQDFDLYFAYTQLSFFQAYNSEYSAPFRDTSYEPELGLNWHPELSFKGWQLKSARVALNHQSNGRSEPLSRSWNRLVGQIQTSRGDLGLGLRIWKRLPENSDSDDNPDIIDFMGHGELSVDYDLGRHRLGLMLRNPLNHAGTRLDWSYRINDRVSLYLQYFNGYGESLIDYDHSVNRIGVGFLLNDWP